MEQVLSSVKVGQKVTITALGQEGESPEEQHTARKLMCLGLLPGDEVEVTGKALFGGPISLKHEGRTFLALRRSHADNIMVSHLE